MSKKKKKAKKKSTIEPAADLESEVQRLREENEMLRARLAKISELASDLPGDIDDEDDEYDEMARDVDDVIEDAKERGDVRAAEPVSVGLS
jgi:hypothetical protein